MNRDLQSSLEATAPRAEESEKAGAPDLGQKLNQERDNVSRLFTLLERDFSKVFDTSSFFLLAT